MPDARGWPDPANPGFPENPSRNGPHLIENERGGRRWVWWRLGGWGFLDGRVGETGMTTQTAADWTYLGPAVAPDGKPVP